MRQRVTIVASYVAQYADPIRLDAGDPLIVHREDDEFPGWHWCTGPDGREGWVHASFFTRADGAARAVRDYSARELTVEPGVRFEIHERLPAARTRARPALHSAARSSTLATP